MAAAQPNQQQQQRRKYLYGTDFSADAAYVAACPEHPIQREIFYFRTILMDYGFPEECFHLPSLLSMGYFDKDVLKRLNVFKNKCETAIREMIALGTGEDFFLQPDVCTTENFVRWLEFLRSTEGVKKMTAMARNRKLLARGGGRFTVSQMAGVKIFEQERADLAQARKKTAAQHEDRIRELELAILKKKDALEHDLEDLADQFYPASTYEPLKHKELNMKCWEMECAANPAARAMALPLESMVIEATLKYREAVNKQHILAYVGDGERLDALKRYASEKILHFRQQPNQSGVEGFTNLLAEEAVPAQDHPGANIHEAPPAYPFKFNVDDQDQQGTSGPQVQAPAAKRGRDSGVAGSSRYVTRSSRGSRGRRAA